MTVTPWGLEEVLVVGALDKDGNPNYKVKRLTINPGQMISLQFHYLRDEIWTVVSGSGVFFVGNEEMIGGIPGDHFEVDRKIRHRIINTSEDTPLVIIESQTGSCNELDIIRLEDIYGRIE